MLAASSSFTSNVHYINSLLENKSLKQLIDDETIELQLPESYLNFFKDKNHFIDILSNHISNIVTDDYNYEDFEEHLCDIYTLDSYENVKCPTLEDYRVPSYFCKFTNDGIMNIRLNQYPFLFKFEIKIEIKIDNAPFFLKIQPKGFIEIN